MSFENLLFKTASKTHFIRDIPIWALDWNNLLRPVSKQKQAHIGCFSFELKTECASKSKKKISHLKLHSL